MITQQQIEEHLLELDGVWLDFPFGDDIRVYKYGEEDSDSSKMLALVEDGSRPVRLSLRCDPQLAKTLREQYETVLPGKNLNSRHWNTIICSGQLPDEDLYDLIRHSYELAKSQD